MSISPEPLSQSKPESGVQLEHKDISEKLEKTEQRTVRWVALATFVSTLVGAILSLVAGTVSFSGSLRRIGSFNFRRTDVLFIGLILAFQLILMALIAVKRNRNRDIIKLKNQLVAAYLSEISNSQVNPKTQRRTTA